jgi:hypothetical protein
MFTFNWGKPTPFAQSDVDLNFEPLAAEDMQSVTQYTRYLHDALAKTLASPGFDEATIRYLSEDIDAHRAVYAGEQKERVGTIYGSFLGSAIAACWGNYGPQWVRSKDGVGIQFAKAKIPWVAFPLTRAFKHIELGNEYSILSYFQAMPDILASDLPA